MTGSDKPDNPNVGHRQRLRDKFIKHGADALLDHELVEMLLYYTIPQGNTNPTAHNLLDQYDDIYGLFSANERSYHSIGGVGEKSALLLELTRAIVNRYSKELPDEQQLKELPCLNTVSASFAFCRKLFIGAEYEKLYMLCLDVNNRVRRTCLLGEGTVDQIPIFTRKIVQEVLDRSAAQVILTHNHPRGKAQPSDGDIDVTYKISHALATIDVPVVDHIIVGEQDCFSFMRENLIKQVQASVQYSLEQREGILKNHQNPLSPPIQ